MRAVVLSFLSVITLRGRVADSFTNDFSRQQSCWNPRGKIRNSPTLFKMVRNIDMVEALVFYGTNSIYQDSDKSMFLPGVENLIEECKRDDTSVIAILDKNTKKNGNENIVFRQETSPAPNPRDLWEAIHSIEVQPKGFGGSSGFGRKAADPERSPLPRHCVVLCDTEEKCRAARFAGMRVLCLTNNDLADAVMNYGDSGETADLEYYWESITMDDIATPGSFWLNPPLPKDDDGNSVNVELVIQSYGEVEDDSSTTTDEDVPNPDDDDDFLASVLMDMDPL